MIKHDIRSAFSIIELIFTIVIIAIVFTVIPKIVFSLSKSDSFAIKQDALFNGVSLMSHISKLPWDNNNTTNDKILRTQSGKFDCNQSNNFYRIGGFVGSRNCLGNDDYNASAIAKEDDFYNDIDDFNGYETNTSYDEGELYGLHTRVSYIDDKNIIRYDYGNQSATVSLDANISTTSTNIKAIDINITYQGKKVTKRGKSISQFKYHATNIGQTYVRKRMW